MRSHQAKRRESSVVTPTNPKLRLLSRRVRLWRVISACTQELLEERIEDCAKEWINFFVTHHMCPFAFQRKNRACDGTACPMRAPSPSREFEPLLCFVKISHDFQKFGHLHVVPEPDACPFACRFSVQGIRSKGLVRIAVLWWALLY